MFTLNLKNRKGQKLYSASYWTSIFDLSFSPNPRCLHFYVVGPSGNVHDPQKPLFLNLETPNYSKQYKKQAIIIFGKSLIWGKLIISKLDDENGKWDPSYRSLKFLNVRSIYSNKHEMEISVVQFNWRSSSHPPSHPSLGPASIATCSILISSGRAIGSSQLIICSS